MAHLCPPWFAYLIDNPLRSFLHRPKRIAGPWLKRGATAVDFGCGFGFMALGMAKLVGPSGRVYAVDLQEAMLEKVRQKARAKGVDAIIRTHRSSETAVGLDDDADFIIAFWSLHEMPEPEGAIRELVHILKPGGHLLIIEPKAHVSPETLASYSDVAQAAGLVEIDAPDVALSMAALLRKPAAGKRSAH